MDPTVWGPHLWMVMHTLSFNYPVNPSQLDKENYYKFFEILTYMIPCIQCRNHYTDFFNKYSIKSSLKNRDALIVWVLACHNNVNKMTNKPEWGKDQLFTHYKAVYNKEIDYRKPQETVYNYKDLVIVFLIAFIFILMTCRKL